MDFISHGLYGGVAFGRKNKKLFWWAFFFGMMPDILVFGPFFVQRFVSAISNHMSFFPNGAPDPRTIPQYVYQGYTSHTLLLYLQLYLGLSGYL